MIGYGVFHMGGEWREIAMAALFLAGNPAGRGLPKRWLPVVLPDVLATPHFPSICEPGGPAGSSGHGALPALREALAVRLARRGLFEAAALCHQAERWQAASEACKQRQIATGEGVWAPYVPLAWADAAPVLHARSPVGFSVPVARFCGGSGAAGPAPEPVRYVAIVGSRRPSAAAEAFAQKATLWAIGGGYGILSGGAPGIDRVARETALVAGGVLLEALPMGLAADPSWLIGPGFFGGGLAAGSCGGPASSWLQVSESPPQEGFSTAAAMARNRLIYMGAVLAVVIEPRFKEGGSWHGAVAALRQRLCRVAVYGGASGAQASLALGALGAIRVSDPAGLASVLRAPPPQPVLFAC